ncbi:MAG: hypothetical protein HKN17_11120 [Rhodothermales bacterium]|nr:hypothetical protein [Rhodothermales bacterium]
MTIADIPTPAVLVEQDRLDRNIREMQDRADSQSVRLRPHTKTHRSVELARRQLFAGAKGITVAKVGEAEVFAEAGFDDIRIAYTVVGQEKLERIVRLLDDARISFCVDTMEGAEAASDVLDRAGFVAEVLIEVDVGYGRCGVTWNARDSASFATRVDALPGLRVVGILTHAGHSYHGPESDQETSEAALRRVSREERDHMLAFAAALREAGLDAAVDGSLEISIGSTPSMRYFENREEDGFRITEIRPGNYVFHDTIQFDLGVVPLSHCALTVLARVVSRHRNPDGSERIFLDSGKKVLTTDTSSRTPGYGTLLYNARVMEPLPHARITGLSEEHGWVKVSGGSTLSVGDTVRIVPNHACVVVNTQSELYVVDGQDVVGRLKVDARGRSV